MRDFTELEKEVLSSGGYKRQLHSDIPPVHDDIGLDEVPTGAISSNEPKPDPEPEDDTPPLEMRDVGGAVEENEHYQALTDILRKVSDIRDALNYIEVEDKDDVYLKSLYMRFYNARRDIVIRMVDNALMHSL